MYPHTTEAIFVEQPFGSFIITSLPARLLLDACYSDRLKALRQGDGSYHLEGSQRRLDDKRLKEIGGFIDTGAACFPNSIILAANYGEEDGLEVTDPAEQWVFKHDNSSGCGRLVIPSDKKVAAIIDGQHRLFGFNYIENTSRLDMPLICSIFFDLPKPYQARLFATINANQRPVNKSQTYELFGYNLEEEEPEKWTPDKLAVFIARKLNTDLGSPLQEHIIVPAENSFSVTAASARRSGNWSISLATVVEGIVRLMSRNPKRDALRMAGEVRYEGHNRNVLEVQESETTPIRELFVECNDEMIFRILRNYFVAVEDVLWKKAAQTSFIHKTVGIQALFDIARPIIAEGVSKRDVRSEYFAEKLKPAARVDFSNVFFHASGSGRTKIRRSLEYALGLEQLDESDPEYYLYQGVIAADRS